jgi:hypothetical protein
MPEGPQDSRCPGQHSKREISQILFWQICLVREILGCHTFFLWRNSP